MYSTGNKQWCNEVYHLYNLHGKTKLGHEAKAFMCPLADRIAAIWAHVTWWSAGLCACKEPFCHPSYSSRVKWRRMDIHDGTAWASIHVRLICLHAVWHYVCYFVYFVYCCHVCFQTLTNARCRLLQDESWCAWAAVASNCVGTNLRTTSIVFIAFINV